MSTLDEIGVRCGTDKSSAYHNYLNRLEPYLSELARPLKILEIGIWKGASVRMWLEYFPDAHITGVDFYNLHGITDPRFEFHHGDATSPEFWGGLGDFDLVVDDGSHHGPDVKVFLGLGFGHVKPGGLWIVEDTCNVDYDVLELIRPIFLELQDHNRDWCGNPDKDLMRVRFIHLLKGLVLIGKKP